MNAQEVKQVDGGNPVIRKALEWIILNLGYDALKTAAGEWAKACEGPHEMTNQCTNGYLRGPH